MATHALGNLKFNLLGRDIAGRLFGRGKTGPADEYEDAPEDEREFDDQDRFDADDADQDQFDADDYDDGRDSDYDDYDDDADDDYGGDDGYDDDGYDDGDYDGDGYDDDGYDDDGYDDDSRYDDDGYDDDYVDEDADPDVYDDDGYEDRYSDEDADDYGGGEPNGLMRYVEDNDWVTYALLFLFPPLGIWLLWRRGLFDKPLRWAVTAASGIWFVVALLLLFGRMFGGAGDRQQTTPTITFPEATLQATAGAGDIPTIDLTGGGATSVPDLDIGEGSDVGENGDLEGGEDSLDLSGLDVEPSPTPLTGSAGAASGFASTAVFVYSPNSGLYYHSSDTCPSIGEGVTTTRVTREIAENSRHQSPCPDCIGGGTTTTYYATVGGTYYHVDSSCSKMSNPLIYTKEAAESNGKKPCPVCILKTQKSLDESDDKTAVLINKNTADKSNISVYATKGGTYFHVKSDCRGMTGASKGSLRDALLAGKKACPTCCPSAGSLYYCTAGGKSYHIDKNCQGMTGAKEVTLAEALVLGKTKCDVCLKNTDTKTEVNADADGGKTVSLTNTSGEVKVYATKKGTYYHTKSNCSGMKDAELFSLKSMILEGKKPCPKCASAAKTTVYATKKGKYYHSYSTCSDMTGAASGTLADALAAGLKRCPKCWGNSKSSNSGATASASTAAKTTSAKVTATATPAPGKKAAATAKPTATPTPASKTKASRAAASATASNTYVYATRTGSYYHLTSSCNGMTGASRVTLKKAIEVGKKPCPVCAATAKRSVYSSDSGKYYHAASTCKQTGLNHGTKRTLAEALMLGQTACPYCMTKTAQTAAAQAATQTNATTAHSTYHAGQSGVRVYATATGKYYHTSSGCSNLSGAAIRVTLETALNYGKKACPACASGATRKVYATRGGKYYHYSKADAGSGAKQGTLAAALAYGLDPCPNCVKRAAEYAAAEQAASEAESTYTTGTSGIKVYATLGSKYFHAKANCSGLSGASRVSLETALNYGKKPCPVCLAAASRKVYASASGSYYHYSKAHAGSGATAGTLAEARAFGLKACPLCTVLAPGSDSYDNGGAEDAPVSTEEYAAASDSNVYIDLGSANDYYHKAAKCSGANFSGGEKVTLQYAIDWGYKACPYCNPPTAAIPDSTGA